MIKNLYLHPEKSCVRPEKLCYFVSEIHPGVLCELVEGYPFHENQYLLQENRINEFNGLYYIQETESYFRSNDADVSCTDLVLGVDATDDLRHNEIYLISIHKLQKNYTLETKE